MKTFNYWLCWSVPAVQAVHGMNEHSAEGRYIRGVVDAYLGRSYNDGITQPHDFTVCIPSDDPYRLGFLEGKAYRLSK